MALYTVSSSGQLKIADTGLKTPVSFFTPEGIATGAVADGPLAGNNSRVYIVDGQGNRYQSSGQLKVLPGTFITGGNALAATSLGEIPLGGDDNFELTTSVVKGFITSVNQSSGNLVVTGNVVATFAYLRTSSGQLQLNGNVTQSSKRLEISNTGQLRLSGSKVAPSIRNFNSSGQLRLTGSTVSRIILVANSSGNLLVTRTFAEGVNRNSTGQLKVTGSFTRGITLQPTSTGLLTVTTDWYTVNRIGGLSTEALASSPIAAGTDPIQNIRHTTLIGSYGTVGKNSSGLITFTPIGTPASDLSQDGALAGSALAGNSIGERRFNPDRTQFRQLLNIDSSGALKFDNSVKYRIDNAPGQLVLIGFASGFNNDRKSSGSLVLTTSRSLQFVRNFLTSGNLKATPTGENPLALDSGIAGSALASLPLGGGLDLLAGRTRFNSIRAELSSGKLVTTGVAGIGLKRLSSGQLVLTSTLATSSLRKESTAGQLKLSTVSVTRSISIQHSAGQLVLAETDSYRTKWTEESRGQLTLTGSNVHRSLQIELTSGQLKLSSVVATRAIFATTSSGQELVATISQNPLTINNSGLAGSSLASLSIAGGLDLPGNNTLFRSLRNEISRGQSVLNGYNVHRSLQLELSSGQLKLTSTLATSSLRKELTSGQLKLTSTLATSSRRNESSSGQLKLTGSVVTRSRRNESSSGSLKLYPVDAYRIIIIESGTDQLKLTGRTVSSTTFVELSSGNELVKVVSQNPLSVNNSGLAGSSLASISIAGGLDLPGNNTSFSSRRNEISSGRLLLSSKTASSVKFDSAGNLKLSGSTVSRTITTERTAGNLIVNRTFASRAIIVEHSAGAFILSNTDTYRNRIIERSSGNLTISGSTVSRLLNTERSSGQLKLSTVSSTRLTIAPTSSGNELVATISQNPLSINNGGLAGSPLASISIAGGLDLPGNNTLFRSLRNEISRGQLYVTGTSVHSSLENEISSTGRLVTTGSTVGVRTLGFNTNGRLIVTGTQVKNVVKSRISSATLKLTPTGANDSLDVSAVIAGSALADHPIAGAYELTTLKTVVSYISRGQFHYDDSSAGLITKQSTGNLLLTGATSTRSILTKTTNGQLVLQANASTRGILVITSNGQLKLTGTSVTSEVYSKKTSGQLLLSSSRSTELLIKVTSAGRLIVSGIHSKNVSYSRSTSGSLLLTGSYNRSTLTTIISNGTLILTSSYSENISQGEKSSGNLLLTGTHDKSVIHTVSSVGSITESGSTNIVTVIGGKTVYEFTSSGNIKLSGTNVKSVIHTVSSVGSITESGSTEIITIIGGRGTIYEVKSSGNLLLTGNTRAKFIANAKPIIRGGGGYVYATSWDILKPYFPDDRHILGYRDLLTSGTGVVGISGSSTVEFIPVPKVQKSKGKSLFDYIKETEQSKKVTPITVTVPKPVVSKFKQQALKEDEMLLNGTLLDIDPLGDELDQELLY